MPKPLTLDQIRNFKLPKDVADSFIAYIESGIRNQLLLDFIENEGGDTACRAPQPAGTVTMIPQPVEPAPHTHTPKTEPDGTEYCSVCGERLEKNKNSL